MQFVFKFWQLASGNFIPVKTLGKSYMIEESFESVIKAIKERRHK